jgi:hypothetical protein
MKISELINNLIKRMIDAVGEEGLRNYVTSHYYAGTEKPLIQFFRILLISYDALNLEITPEKANLLFKKSWRAISEDAEVTSSLEAGFANEAERLLGALLEEGVKHFSETKQCIPYDEFVANFSSYKDCFLWHHSLSGSNEGLSWKFHLSFLDDDVKRAFDLISGLLVTYFESNFKIYSEKPKSDSKALDDRAPGELFKHSKQITLYIDTKGPCGASPNLVNIVLKGISKKLVDAGMSPGKYPTADAQTCYPFLSIRCDRLLGRYVDAAIIDHPNPAGLPNPFSAITVAFKPLALEGFLKKKGALFNENDISDDSDFFDVSVSLYILSLLPAEKLLDFEIKMYQLLKPSFLGRRGASLKEAISMALNTIFSNEIPPVILRAVQLLGLNNFNIVSNTPRLLVQGRLIPACFPAVLAPAIKQFRNRIMRQGFEIKDQIDDIYSWHNMPDTMVDFLDKLTKGNSFKSIQGLLKKYFHTHYNSPENKWIVMEGLFQAALFDEKFARAFSAALYPEYYSDDIPYSILKKYFVSQLESLSENLEKIFLLFVASLFREDIMTLDGFIGLQSDFHIPVDHAQEIMILIISSGALNQSVARELEEKCSVLLKSDEIEDEKKETINKLLSLSKEMSAKKVKKSDPYEKTLPCRSAAVDPVNSAVSSILSSAGLFERKKLKCVDAVTLTAEASAGAGAGSGSGSGKTVRTPRSASRIRMPG